MKRVLILFLFAMLLPLAFYGESEKKKVYVHHDQIAIGGNGIFVHFESEWIPAESVGFDSYGLYAQLDHRDLRAWWCPNCGYCNAYWD